MYVFLKNTSCLNRHCLTSRASCIMSRENTTWWKVKDIDPIEQRAKGFCPLTPKEVGMFLTALGFPSNTPIYIAAGEIYGGGSSMADLQSRYPLLMNKVSSPQLV